ncbi:hypothetical protein FE374_16700 [Georgenia yuyongxinii]|uniref:Permease n=1 Tax=Georgenia yuyongxinii TaxID=2589797 RepID=A0A5B8C7A6_9MICO|nr:hypothetical protein [Georgenia yuyongxinii]QDC26037.1 hypothetical protein FE374_16700 [Georgenia yuyongxinii]
MGASTRAAVTALGAAVLALAGFAARDVLTGLVLLLCLVFALGWPRLIDLPTYRGASLVIAGTAIAALAAVRFGTVAGLAIVAGLAVVAAFVHQMLRRDGRPRLVESVAGVVTGCAVVVSAAGWVAVGEGLTAESLVVAGAASIAAAAAATAVPARTELVAVLATVVAGAAGLLAGLLLELVGPVPGLLVGLAVGILTAALHVLFGLFPASSRVRPALSAAMLPLLVPGMAVHLVAGLLSA